jgi:hypothetical protein
MFCFKQKPRPWFHPESGEFWSVLSEVRGWSEGVELVFDGELSPGPLHFLCRILSGEQESEWRRHNKKWDFGLKRRDSELPWYHPNNDYFWRQISDIRISAKTTVLVFLGSALHDDFRLLLRQRQDTVRTPSGDFLLTSRDLADRREKWYPPRDEAAMFNFWAIHHPEIVDKADWREYICEQARIENELVKRHAQLKSVINDAFIQT